MNELYNFEKDEWVNKKKEEKKTTYRQTMSHTNTKTVFKKVNT